MRIGVLGVTGMLGHRLAIDLATAGHEVVGTVRQSRIRLPAVEKSEVKIITELHAEDPDFLEKMLPKAGDLDLIVNCIGVIKQVKTSPAEFIEINSLFPQRLSEKLSQTDIVFLQISTDCVFTGHDGFYSERNKPDAQDVYGLSKRLGEVGGKNFTMRTSFIGHELNHQRSLLEWFLSQEKEVEGFDRAIFSGITTNEMATVITDYFFPFYRDIPEVFHVAAEPISKYKLLSAIRIQYGRNIQILPNTTMAIDRSLNGGLFREKTGYNAPSWPTMIGRMQEAGRV